MTPLTKDELEDLLSQVDCVLKFDGFDACITGIARRCGQPDLLVYSYDLILSHLMVHDGLSRDDAVEHIDFNIAGAWMGELTPVIVYRD